MSDQFQPGIVDLSASAVQQIRTSLANPRVILDKTGLKSFDTNGNLLSAINADGTATFAGLINAVQGIVITEGQSRNVIRADMLEWLDGFGNRQAYLRGETDPFFHHQLVTGIGGAMQRLLLNDQGNSDFLQATNNLSDLVSWLTARTNLGIHGPYQIDSQAIAANVGATNTTAFAHNLGTTNLLPIHLGQQDGANADGIGWAFTLTDANHIQFRFRNLLGTFTSPRCLLNFALLQTA